MDTLLYGGIEAGGTKFICCVSDESGNIKYRAEIPTTTPDETLRQVVDFFGQNPPVAAIGVGSFGPLELNPNSPQFGAIKHSPKPGWGKVPIKQLLEDTLKVPVTIDTDVNCSALGHHAFGLARGHDNFVYLTVGTGIGGSLMVNGHVYHGTSHLEIGHMHVNRAAVKDSFAGICAFHKDCLEGLASGTAMHERWGTPSQDITNPAAWELEAAYLGQAISNIILTMRPELIIVGGGVFGHEGLIGMVQEKVAQYINDYIDLPDLSEYILVSDSPDCGILGAVQLVVQ